MRYSITVGKLCHWGFSPGSSGVADWDCFANKKTAKYSKFPNEEQLCFLLYHTSVKELSFLQLIVKKEKYKKLQALKLLQK